MGKNGYRITSNGLPYISGISQYNFLTLPLYNPISKEVPMLKSTLIWFKRFNWKMKAFVFLLLIGGLNSIASIAFLRLSPERMAQAEQRALAEQAKNARSLEQVTAARAVKATIRDSLRDPSSLVFESMRVSEDSRIVCTEYTAKNGFGGMNRKFVVYVDRSGFDTADVWKKHCSGPMNDWLWAVNS